MVGSSLFDRDGYAQKLIEFKAAQLCKRPGFSRSDRQDIEQELWGFLHTRMPRFDATRASQNTFVARVINCGVVTIIRYHDAAKRAPGWSLMSLDAPARPSKDGQDDAGVELAAPRNGPYHHDLVHDVARLRAMLPSETHRAVVDLLAQGGTANSIAGDLGISRRAAARYVAEVAQWGEASGLRDYL
ncbi:MAG TPA: hypothetical protein PKE29_01555 [Phycisphaerales bacterium]|nr:hypothetical protein [Phycisphaerales bacterium]